MPLVVVSFCILINMISCNVETISYISFYPNKLSCTIRCHCAAVRLMKVALLENLALRLMVGMSLPHYFMFYFCCIFIVTGYISFNIQWHLLVVCGKFHLSGV